MQIFVENIEDNILFLTFYCFSWWIPIFEVNISHPIVVIVVVVIIIIIIFVIIITITIMGI